MSVEKKLAALDKDLEKTGMLSEIMTTDNVLSSSEDVPAVPAIESDELQPLAFPHPKPKACIDRFTGWLV